MQSERKKAQLRFQGVNPMTFVELADQPMTDEWTPDQDAAAAAVAQAIKSYITTTEALANIKYEHLRHKIPDYMAHPDHVLAAICMDGVVIRYEKKHDDRWVGVAVIPQGIADVAALLSQNLVYVGSPDAPNPLKDDFGVELQVSAHFPSDGTSQNIVAARIWFQTKNISPQYIAQPGAKPYCLLSVRNQLDLEIHGELIGEAGAAAPNQPFIARSTMRLSAGWECIEVFPGFSLDAWNAEFAPLWAEYDVLGAALIAQTKDAQLSTLDPRASARRQYASLLAEFKALLDSKPEREQILHAFLQKNPVLLCPTHVRMWPKLPLGVTITDFVFRDANHEYLLVELERSTLQLFRQDGHATAELTHAHGQIVDWKRYLEDNLQTVQRELGLAGITPNPNGLLVIGRSQSLLHRDRRQLQTMMNESPKLRIMTYDDVYENAKAVLENLLGPFWDTGGATQIYYPRVI